MFKLTAKELRSLMEKRGAHGLSQLNDSYQGIQGLIALLKTNPETGLCESTEQLEERREMYGVNMVPLKKTKPLWRFMLEALKDPLIIILIVCAVLSLAVSFVPKPREEVGPKTTATTTPFSISEIFTADPNISMERGEATNSTNVTTMVTTVPTLLSLTNDTASNQTDFEYSTACAAHLDWLESIVIIFAVLLVVFIGSGMDYHKEQEFRKLQAKVNKAQMINTIRNSQIETIPIAELVVGDICLVKYGDLLPADGLIVASSDIKTDESSLTGESDQINKSATTDPFLLAGTHVIEGSGRMLVIAVGSNSQYGIIFALLADDDPEDEAKPDEEGEDSRASSRFSQVSSAEPAMKNPNKNKSILQEKLTAVAELIGKIAIFFGVSTAVILIIRFLAEYMPVKGWSNTYWLHIIKFVIVGITVMVVAIPEGLPLAVTLALAFSVRRMLADNNMVRHIDATETMGSATTICSDKTGTLTTNRMTCVRSVLGNSLYEHGSGTMQVDTRSFNVVTAHPKHEEFHPIMVKLVSQSIAINTSYSSHVELPSVTGGARIQKGDKTECALLFFLINFGMVPQEFRKKHPESSFVKLFTFSSERKFMATAIRTHFYDKQIISLYIKGAAERLLNLCSRCVNNEGEEVPISDEMRDDYAAIIDGMANDGLRTLVIACREFSSEPDWLNEEEVFKNLSLIAVCGIEDPIRSEVPEAIRLCWGAGITVRMITGDNINTARSIAKKCGILKSEDSSALILEGHEFNREISDENGVFSQSKFDVIWPSLRVLARSSPADKFKMVNGIINSRAGKHREVVAVTGDGTNDAPALKRADVGFAMGIAGTDVAKEACDIIITDDNFSSIVKAVMWGRNVYDAVCKFIQFQMTVNVVAVLLAFTGAVAMKQSPLKPIQLLWVNLIMDTLASLTLATDPPTEKLLKRPPQRRTAPIISHKMWRFVIGNSLYQLAVLFVFMYTSITFLEFDPDQQCPDVRLRLPEDETKCMSPTDPRMKIEDAECANVHFTFVFNTFIMMTLANQINARCLHGERNIFYGLHRNPLFISLWLTEFGLHIILIQVLAEYFVAVKLNLQQWLISIAAGFAQLLWYQILICYPVKKVNTYLLVKCRRVWRRKATSPTDATTKNNTSATMQTA